MQLEAATGALAAMEFAGVLRDSEVSYRACSGGAPVAALHASGMRGEDIARLIGQTPMSDLITLPFLSRWCDASGVLQLLYKRMPAEPLTNCRVAVTRTSDMKPCMCDATPVTVLASMSIPGVFRPQRINGEECVDGGVFNLIPTPPIPDVPLYDHIYILLSPVSPEDTSTHWYRPFETELKSAAGLLDREITQILEDGWDRLENVDVFRPSVPEAAAERSLMSSLLDWSPGRCMIREAYNNALRQIRRKQREGQA